MRLSFAPLWLFLSTFVAAMACGGPPPVATLPPSEPIQIGGDGGTVVMPAAVAKWDDTESPVPISDKDPMWGNRTAPVTIVVFSDFQCPFCSRLLPTLDQVRTHYGPTKVRIVWKNYPLTFHDRAKPAAEAAMGVFELGGPSAFWKFHDLAFRNQRTLDEANFLSWATEAGVRDINAFTNGLRANQWAARIDADIELAERVGVKGTPASFVNGVFVSGAQGFEMFKKNIDDELERASALSAGGIAADRVYVERSKANHLKPAQKVEEDDDKEDTTTRFNVPVGTSPFLGKKDAQITIVEFSDFQCPYCKRAEATLEEIRQKYGAKVRIVWKNEPLPFHPRALPAARLALEARAQKGDVGFWAMHKRLFEVQPKLEDADLEALGKEQGIDPARVKRALDSKTKSKVITDDMELADDVQATGTPHFFVNGRRLVGAQPLSKFATIIDEELRTTQTLLNAGTPQAKLYEVLMKGAKGPAPFERKEVSVDAAMLKGRPFRGAANAKVTILEFSDFQCPFCARVNPTIEELLKTYGNQVKLVWMDRPLSMHKDARLAAEAAREAFQQKGNDGFWKMHAKLFGNQQSLSRSDLNAYASELGLDTTKFAAALDGHTHEAAIAATEKVAEDAKIGGTPSFIINGYFISGAQDLHKFERAVKLALNPPAPAAPPTVQPVPFKPAPPKPTLLAPPP